MAIDISILDDAGDRRTNQIYHGTHTQTEEFESALPPFSALLRKLRASDDERVILKPDEYKAFIPEFEAALITTPPEQAPYLTAYDCVRGCYEGLRRAAERGKSIRISS